MVYCVCMGVFVREIYETLLELGAKKDSVTRVVESYVEETERKEEKFLRKDGVEFATKADMAREFTELDKRLIAVETELRYLRWMIGGLIFPMLIAIAVGVFLG